MFDLSNINNEYKLSTIVCALHSEAQRHADAERWATASECMAIIADLHKAQGREDRAEDADKLAKTYLKNCLNKR